MPLPEKNPVLIPVGTALRKSTVHIIAKVMCMAKRTHGKEVVGQARARLIYVLHYFTAEFISSVVQPATLSKC